MRRIRIHVPELRPGALRLEGEEQTHIARVLRLKAKDEVELFDGAGGRAPATLLDVQRRHSELHVGDLIRSAPPRALRAFVAAPKGKRPRRLVEALTELGVSELTPLLCVRSEGRPPRGDELRRWALEALKQCQRDWLPAIGEPLSPAELLERLEGDLLALLPDTTSAPPLREVLPPAPVPLAFAIGPEGGFSPEERALLAERFQPLSLGPAVLRIETAAEALVAGVHALWGAPPSSLEASSAGDS